MEMIDVAKIQGEAKNCQQTPTLHMGAQYWRGWHKEIPFEIAVHPCNTMESFGEPAYWTWCYYIVLVEKQIPQRLYFDTFCHPYQRYREPDEMGFESPSMWYHRREPDWIEDLPWHGGCTYYHVNGGLHGEPMWIKAGCDFAHLWDQERGYPYDLPTIEMYCRETIDAMLKAHPDIKPRKS